MNTGIGARAPNDEWLRFQAFMRRVGTEIVAGQLVRLTLVQPTTDEVIAAYDAPFPVPESRVGIVQFPELVATSSDHPSAPAMLDVRERLRTFDRPGARPLRRQRPDLLAPRGRGDGRAAAERRARPAGRGRGTLPAGGPRRVLGERIAAWLRAECGAEPPCGSNRIHTRSDTEPPPGVAQSQVTARDRNCGGPALRRRATVSRGHRAKVEVDGPAAPPGSTTRLPHCGVI